MATPDLPSTTTFIKVVDEGGSFIRPIIATIILGFGIFILFFGLQLRVVATDWEKYRCQPQYMAIAGLLGKNTNENFAYCTEKVFSVKVPGVVNPMYKILAQGTGVMGTILDTANSLRLSLATLVGGVTNIVQDFTSRITQFFFSIRAQVQRMRSLMYRIYGTMFAMFYMVFSGITAAQNFFDTTVGRILNFFCFPPETPIQVEGRGTIPISEVRIGDRIIGGDTCTAVFRFWADGQEMVQLGGVQVSTNHYVMYGGRWIMAGEHPDAQRIGPWMGGRDRPLICLNTDTHKFRLGAYTFSDFDETDAADATTERWVEKTLNGGTKNQGKRSWSTYGAVMQPSTLIRTATGLKSAADLRIGDLLDNGSRIIGLVQKRTNETTAEGITPSTLIYHNNEWTRNGRISKRIDMEMPENYVGVVAYPYNYITTDSGLHLRDYVEVLNQDAERAYSAALALVGAQ